MSKHPLVRALAAAALIGLAACGGGGGGGDGANRAGDKATGTVPLSGRVSFEQVPNPDGRLEYTATTSQPVRGAAVDVLDAQSSAVLASTTTDEQGAYSALLPANLRVTVRVRAQLAHSGPDGSWDVSVRDNTRGNAVYAMESPSFQVQQAPTTRDLHAESGWGGTRYAGARVAAPFAILDTLRSAMAKVRSVVPQAAFPPLRVFWSASNAPASGRVDLGQIGTTSYTSDAAGPVIYLLGKEDVDTDEYDASVIAHEWGHYYQNAFSRDDSPGGPHGFSELLDMRLAFSEGWGNAWSGMALGRANYTDSVGPAQGTGTHIALADTDPATTGWFRESSVQAILWRLHALHGFAHIHAAMAGPLRTTPALTGIHSFAAAYAAVLPSAQSDLSAVLAANAVSGVTADPWAGQESNDGGVPGVLPLYRPAMIGAPTTVCVGNGAGEPNKLGSYAFMRLAVPTARNYQLVLTGPPAADPDVVVFAGAKLAAGQGLGSSESATVALPRGEVVLAVNDANNSAARTCLTLSVQ